MFDTITRIAPSISLPVGTGELEVERLGLPTEHLRQERLRGVDLGLAVRLLLHDLRVDAERHVVDEEAVIDGRVVDLALVRVAEGVHRLAGVVAVEPEVEREVVACPRAHTHEGEPVLHGDRGDEGLGAVTPGHAEAVGPSSHGIACELLEVETSIEHHRLHSELGRQLAQAEALDLAAARPGVAQQDGTGRGSAGAHMHVEPVQLAHHRCPPAGHRHAEQDHEEHDPECDPVGTVEPVDQGGPDDHQADRHPDAADRSARHALGDHPPPARDGDDHADETDHHAVAVAEQHRDHEGHECGRADEGRDRGKPATGRDGDARVVHGASWSIAASADFTLG